MPSEKNHGSAPNLDKPKKTNKSQVLMTKNTNSQNS